jgi:hypothetical protein
MTTGAWIGVALAVGFALFIAWTYYRIAKDTTRKGKH